MKEIFKQGEFRPYARLNLDSARGKITKSYQYGKCETTVFISHKHDDLEDLKGVLGMLESRYGVEAYIDSRDPSMPLVTSAITAANIKERISSCDKFIFLATNGAIESKWCNWELGYGDAKKYKDHIALFLMEPETGGYKGNEYMGLYPYITYSDGTERYDSGEHIERDYYVCTNEGGKRTIISLEKWLSRR